VKPRSTFTTFQFVIVVGVPGATVGELLAVAVGVTVGEPTAVVVAVTVGVLAVAVAVGIAPSSRNNMSGLLHHFNFARGTLAGSGVAVGPACGDAKGFEHAASSTPASNTLNAR
jgi:ethanolamine utilization microcompartment shell protein EutL